MTRDAINFFAWLRSFHCLKQSGYVCSAECQQSSGAIPTFCKAFRKNLIDTEYEKFISAMWQLKVDNRTCTTGSVDLTQYFTNLSAYKFHISSTSPGLSITMSLCVGT